MTDTKTQTTTVYDDIETVRDLLGLIDTPLHHKQASEAFERVVIALLVNERIAHARN